MKRLRTISASRLLGLAASLGLLLSYTVQASTETWDFENWVDGSATNLVLAATSDTPDTTYWWDYQQYYGGNPITGGFLQLIPPENGRRLAVILPDIDNGAPVKAFKITADVRAGNGTNTPPADGFSISYVRDNDPLLANAAIIQNAGSPPYLPPVGRYFGFAGGDDAATATSPAGSICGENGAKTGLAIAFDAYQGNTLPDTGPGGTPGPDKRGIAVRVDDRTLTQVPMDVFHAGCEEPNSMQTGPYDGTGLYDNLSWCKLEVEKTVDNKVTVIWKGVKILDNYQLTSYFPHRGRLILAGRAGGLNQNVHFDNITLTTTPAIEATFEGLAVNSNLKGWTFTLKDTGESKVSGIAKVIWNGADVTSSITTTRNGDLFLGTYTQAALLPPGSTNHVEVTFTTELSQTLGGIGDASTPQYFTMPAAYALPPSAVSGQPRGIGIGSAFQTFAPNNNSQGENRLSWTEEQILGLHGTNLITGAWPTSTDVMDYQNAETDPALANVGNFRVNGSTQAPPFWDGPDYPVESLGFGLHPEKGQYAGADLNWSIYEDSTIEWFAYVNFPAADVYFMAVNSDDGFRLTTARHAKDRMGEVFLSYEGGRGAGTGLEAGTVYRIAIEQAGVYPIRGIIENRGGGFNVEWYTRDGDQLRLVNSTAAGALEAYQSATGAGAYVQSAVPVRNAVDVLPHQKIRIELANGATATVNAGSIVLKVDGATVTPTVTPGSPVLVVQDPIGPSGWWAPGAHSIELAFTDSATTAYSYQWSFNVGMYQVYQGPYTAGGKWNLYMALRGPQTWVEAQRLAQTLIEPLSGQNKTGHLVTIHSAAERDFVRMIAAGESVWIGLTDDEAFGGAETGSDPASSSQVPPGFGQWAWVTGEPYTWGEWNGGEPNDWNNGEPGEDAIELYNNGLFNDNNDGWGRENVPIRQYVVEFETLMDNKLPEVAISVLPPGPIPGPEGCDGQFGIRVVNNAGNIPTISAAVNALFNPAATIRDSTAPAINFTDPDAAGGTFLFPGDVPIPSHQVGVDDEDLVIVAKTRILIAEAGDYTFGAHGDDGFALRIRGQTWKSVSGIGQTAPGDPSTLVYQYGTGDANTRGVVSLAAGEYDLEFVWFEDGGGASVELYAAKGAVTCDSESKFFHLVGYQPATPPVTFVDVGVSSAGWTVEYDAPGGTGLNNIAEAEAALVGAQTVTGVNAINYRDPDDQGGAQSCSAAFPQDTAGAADDDFAIRATAQLVIPVSGTYHFGFAGDDGGYLQIEGQTWSNIVETADSNSGVINGDRIQFDVNTGNSRTIGAINLAAGTYTIRALFWERGGGAWFWVFGGQPGTGYGVLTANNSPIVSDVGVSIAPCTPRPIIAISLTPGGPSITFTGKLYSAPAVTGQWTEVMNAVSPYTPPAGTGMLFFRSSN
ncbi:MAG TPA: PA14 domain-containing protein [Candidatus Paceibacterota bacterium]|nr:PA14 domain-containing protein [Verrucomicrobiota bacterium]HRZ47290.1 PA14 domain-containing protein [Candidatus Paceibacterota bacterium]